MILFSRFSSFYEGKRIRDILKLNEQLFLEGGGGIRFFFFLFLYKLNFDIGLG